MASEDDSKQAADLKNQGNQKFVAKEYDAAIELYSKSLELDANNYMTLGNRSASYLALNRADEALADAERAVKAAPKWGKGYYRRGSAMMQLGRYEEAMSSFFVANELEPNCPPVLQNIKACAKAISEADKTTVPSIAKWRVVYQRIADPRLRLSVLAHFWNACKEEERFAAFGRLILLVAGPRHQAGIVSGYAPSDMIAMPLANYADVPVPAPWMAFFEPLNAADKVAVFNTMWDQCSDKERTLILKDVKEFLKPGTLDALALDDDDDDCGGGHGHPHGSHGHSHGSHGHSHAAPAHGHSHGGVPCHGHGHAAPAPPPSYGSHGHSHGGQPCHGHGH